MLRAMFVSAAMIALPTSSHGQTNGERLEPIVSQLPRNSAGLPMYWLEMHSAIGWEKMMLVFGYASNQPVCERLAVLAAADAPDREFKCTPAN